METDADYKKSIEIGKFSIESVRSRGWQVFKFQKEFKGAQKHGLADTEGIVE